MLSACASLHAGSFKSCRVYRALHEHYDVALISGIVRNISTLETVFPLSWQTTQHVRMDGK